MFDSEIHSENIFSKKQLK